MVILSWISPRFSEHRGSGMWSRTDWLHLPMTDVLRSDEQPCQVQQSGIEIVKEQLVHYLPIFSALLHDFGTVVFIYVHWTVLVSELASHPLGCKDYQVFRLEFVEVYYHSPGLLPCVWLGPECTMGSVELRRGCKHILSHDVNQEFGEELGWSGALYRFRNTQETKVTVPASSLQVGEFSSSF